MSSSANSGDVKRLKPSSAIGLEANGTKKSDKTLTSSSSRQRHRTMDRRKLCRPVKFTADGRVTGRLAAVRDSDTARWTNANCVGQPMKCTADGRATGACRQTSSAVRDSDTARWTDANCVGQPMKCTADGRVTGACRLVQQFDTAVARESPSGWLQPASSCFSMFC
jgi:hypothetical protein